ncbi:hypothetical protein DF185_10310 [Marinifilum breve]|uniref:ATP-grasp fold RimK-type domain-containing protein n=1 Tax=Marinifilum breve TaxID=2184082 RepID=A0A2V3ZX63_9BACT|nr:hypothetical protein [Marinifilum breve]PXY01039.1 hypothetical protein DF185_10310 [Marinifilum breve]
MSRKIKIPFMISKWLHFEFWPFWFFYIPMFFYGFYLAIKARAFAYFTPANPAMKFGGAFGMDKMKILSLLDKKYIPQGFVAHSSLSIQDIKELMNKHEIDFPIVGKPNVGERGVGVEKIDSEKDLITFLQNKQENILFQEFIDYPIELGVFYHRFPISKKDGITSIVRKEFLTITGNGKLKFSDLVKANIRASSRLSYLKNKYKTKWDQIVPVGISYKLEPIGNHNRGTKFLDGNDLINEQLVAVFREISEPLDGYYYGRFDMKVNSIEDLYEGKKIKIIELNGTNSEPAHIYDPDFPLLKAYKVIIQHMKLIYDISMENRKLGVKPDSFKNIIRALFKRSFSKEEYKKEGV